MILKLHNRTIETSKPAFVMGIVNANNDSFWENSRGGVDRALQLIDEGADIIDIGSESTRPGAKYIDEQTEMSLLIPVIQEIRKHSSCPISVDTRKSSVMKAAFENGADILNDVSALEDDINIGPFAASVNIPVILMHKKGNPVIMQKDTTYQNVFSEVNNYLLSRAEKAISLGIKKENIIIDPGIGFGKNLESNLILIKRIGELCNGQYKILMALSRKTCIGELTDKKVEDRLSGTLCADIYSVLHGASIIRVHDVAETVDTMKVLEGILNAWIWNFIKDL